MNRWMISSAVTVLIVIILFTASFFVPERKTFEGQISSGQSVVTVLKRHRTVKKEKKQVKKSVADSMAPSKTEQEETVEETPAETDENLTDENSEAEEATLGAAGEKAMESYKTYALKRIASKKTYPLAARAKGFEGKVKLHVKIGTDGIVEVLEAVETCEFELLNEAAVNAVKKAAPFKKLPPELKKFELDFTVVFSLNE